MAIDPFATDDQKKRLRQVHPNSHAEQARATVARMDQQPVSLRNQMIGASLGLAGAVVPGANVAAAAAGAEMPARRSAGSRSMRRSPAQQEAAFNAMQARNDTYTAWQEAAAANVDAQEAQLTRDGVHRIRRGIGRHGETVYENVPERESLIVGDSEEMMFGPNGQRIGRGLSRPGAPAEGFDAYGTAQQQQGAMNEYYAALNAENAPQLRAMGRRVADQQRAGTAPGGTDPGYQYYTDERGNRTLLTQQQAAARGLARPGTANADARTALELARFQETINQNRIVNERAEIQDERAERQLTRQETSDLRRFSRENPEAFLAEETALVDWQNPEAVREYFQTDRGRLTKAALDAQFRTTNTEGRRGGIPGLRGLGLQRGSNWGDLERARGLAALGGGYRVGGDMWSGATFDSGSTGLPPDAIEGLIQYYGEQNAQRERDRQR